MLNYFKFSSIIFCVKMIRYSQKQLGERLWIISTFYAEISCYSYICTIDVQTKPNSGMNDSIRIMFIKIIIIIKINFIEIYSKNMSLISNKCDFIKVFIRKEYKYIILSKERVKEYIIRFFKHFTCNKLSRNKF